MDRSGNGSKLNKFAPPTSGGKFAHLCSSFPILSLSEVDRLDWQPFSMLLGSERASDRAGVSYRSRLCHPPQGGLSSRSLHLGWGGGIFRVNNFKSPGNFRNCRENRYFFNVFTSCNQLVYYICTVSLCRFVITPLFNTTVGPR